MSFRTLLIAALIVSLGGVAFAELQNVEIGGSIRIRGNYFNLDSIDRASFIEQRTRLNVRADFTQEVSAFIELDSYDYWGEDFRSWYLCGNDFRGGCDVGLYQAYIEARNLWGTPLSLRVGRQEIALGNQFLVGVNDTSSFFSGLSFDAVRLTFANEVVNIDAIAAKLAENFGDFAEDDVDFYTVYGSYIGIEDITLDAYWMYVRDRAGVITRLANGQEADMHTVGLRGAGVIGGFDFEVEGAYQFGDLDGVPSACPLGFGEADVDFDAFAVNAEVGYTFDMSLQPRLFARFAYLGGGKPDNNWWSNDRNLAFSRMFSNVQYSEFLDDWTFDNGAMSNALVYTLGVQGQVTESFGLKLIGSYLTANEKQSRRARSKSLGWEVGLYADYNYSEDLVFRAGYAHLFGKKGLEPATIRWSGLAPWQGDRKDDYDYAFIETELCF
ncbi:MAG TPA: alginate export family protein [Candidatus Hydrogenedentes bacterium]|nr:alginate export family protein [Candidatus Hydrogenedentota bacterium]HOM49002.1 alginate export family protein [Candidatus Hydrogenedentota bacterium]HOR50818.1 alginate export family protein [Candidatus Hydrogenedentota bacterium]HPK24035.1 alginate export family protein [Candidatus Hydrogenedentota bacterium]HPX87231.1 alginate export family protein [Candidatus Hydrogenedentota bacterium]